MKYKNMKIEINKDQPLDDVMREVERLGYDCDFQSTDNPNFVALYHDGSCAWYIFDVEMDLVTLEELKAMTND